MLAYAANSPRTAARSSSPKALTIVLAGHAALIAAVLTARMDVAGPVIDKIPDIINIAPDKPPPPPPPDPTVDPQPAKTVTQPTFIERTPPVVDMEQARPIELDTGPTLRDIGAVIGSGPTFVDPPRKGPVRLGPRLATAGDALKPPYPNDKLRAEEEATLKLRLTIDARGRVVAVEPVGAVDASFLAAARRHILKAWRYKPATEDGVAVSTSTVITLSFRLEDV
jgi:protein TonB